MIVGDGADSGPSRFLEEPGGGPGWCMEVMVGDGANSSPSRRDAGGRWWAMGPIPAPRVVFGSGQGLLGLMVGDVADYGPSRCVWERAGLLGLMVGDVADYGPSR
jgi:hypothetical protein